MNIHPDFNRPQAIERCAWYLRVSTPKQKLEHQREHVARYCQDNGIIIVEFPPSQAGGNSSPGRA